MKNLLLCIISLVFLAITPVVSQAGLPLIDIDVAVGGWQCSPEGDIAYDLTGTATDLDLEDDFDFDDESKVFARAKLELPIPILPDIYIVAAPMEFTGDSELSDTFTFGNETYDANVPFSSKLTLDQYDIAFYWGIPFLELATIGKLNIDLGINVRIIDLETEVVQGTITESEDISVPIPMAYVAVQIGPIARISIEAEVRAISYDDNSLTSVTGRLKFNILGPSYLAAGYRYDDISVDEDDIDIDASFGGPFVEAGLKF
jgi:outer membrane protein